MAENKLSLEYKIAMFSLIIASVTLIANVYFNYLNNKTQLKLKEYELTHLEKKKLFSGVMNILYDYNSVRDQISGSDTLRKNDSLKNLLVTKQREFQKNLYELYPLLETKTMQEFRLRSVEVINEMERLNKIHGKKTFLSDRITTDGHTQMYIDEGSMENKEAEIVKGDSAGYRKYSEKFQNNVNEYYVYMRDSLYPKIFTYY